MKNIKLAWRNLWRNKRRTIITATSVFFAIFFAIIMRSLQLGTYNHMFTNAIESYTGYIQLQHEDFWDDRVLENSIEYSENLENELKNNSNVQEIIPRVESFALASNGTQSKGVMVLGIEPEKEILLSSLNQRLVNFRLDNNSIKKLKQENIPERIKKNLHLFNNTSYSNTERMQLDLNIKDEELEEVLPFFKKHASYPGNYLSKEDQSVLIGDKLARYLGINTGDTLILIGQGYQARTAAGKYAVKGIVRLTNPELDSRVVYIPLASAQELYSLNTKITSCILHVQNKSQKAIRTTIDEVQKSIEAPQKIISWKKMNELMIQQMDADNKSGMIMIGILYLVIAFGVFGTVLMMTSERRREFGVLVAIGMQKTKLITILIYEMIMVGILGLISGMLASAPIIIIGNKHPIRFGGKIAKMYEDMGFEPIMPFQWFDSYYFWQIVVVLFIILIAMSYPIHKIRKLKEVNALKA